MWRGTSLVLEGARSARHIRVGQAWGPCRGSRGKPPDSPDKLYVYHIGVDTALVNEGGGHLK